jgi:hypothetical protein
MMIGPAIKPGVPPTTVCRSKMTPARANDFLLNIERADRHARERGRFKVSDVDQDLLREALSLTPREIPGTDRVVWHAHLTAIGLPSWYKSAS